MVQKDFYSVAFLALPQKYRYPPVKHLFCHLFHSHQKTENAFSTKLKEKQTNKKKTAFMQDEVDCELRNKKQTLLCAYTKTSKLVACYCFPTVPKK